MNLSRLRQLGPQQFTKSWQAFFNYLTVRENIFVGTLT